MQKTNTVSGVLQGIILNTVGENLVATVVTTIITTVTSATCNLIILKDGVSVHTISFTPPQGQSIFIDSKLFIPSGYSLKVQSTQTDSSFTIMYDQSENV